MTLMPNQLSSVTTSGVRFPRNPNNAHNFPLNKKKMLLVFFSCAIISSRCDDEKERKIKEPKRCLIVCFISRSIIVIGKARRKRDDAKNFFHRLRRRFFAQLSVLLIVRSDKTLHTCHSTFIVAPEKLSALDGTKQMIKLRKLWITKKYQHVGAPHGEYSKKSNSIRFLYGEMFRRWKILRYRCVCARKFITNTSEALQGSDDSAMASGTLWAVSNDSVGVRARIFHTSVLQRAENALLSPPFGLPWNFTVFMKWHNLCRTTGGWSCRPEDDALCPSKTRELEGKSCRRWWENVVRLALF